jgi:hypothetical protein
MKKRKTVVISILIAVLLAGHAGIKSLANRIAKEKLNEAIKAIAFYADLSYEKVSVDLFGFNAHIKNIIITPVDSLDTITIEELIIYTMDGNNEIPQFMHIILQGIHTESEGNIESYLRRLGYDEKIKMDMELDYRYHELERELHLNHLSYGSNSIGTINLNYHISNFDLDFERLLTASPPFPDILIHRAELSFQDTSLVSHFLQKKAAEEKKEIAEVVQEITDAIDGLIADTDGALKKESLEALKNFVKIPEQIFIFIDPKEPISLDRVLNIKNLDEALSLLNAKVKT